MKIDIVKTAIYQRTSYFKIQELKGEGNVNLR